MKDSSEVKITLNIFPGQVYSLYEAFFVIGLWRLVYHSQVSLGLIYNALSNNNSTTYEHKHNNLIANIKAILNIKELH